LQIKVLKSTFITLQNLKKCRYLDEARLPPTASPEQMDILRSAFREGRVKVLGRALNWMTGVWNVSVDAFIKDIFDHLETGGRIFRKLEQNSARLLPNKFQASVWIREPNDDDDYDDGTVYVELIITENEVILICNTHEHEAGIRRLPH
jgi:hypothetical protein